MDIKAIREMSDEDILNEIEDQKFAIYKLRFQKASGQLENLNAIHDARRIVARLKTVLGERQRATAIGDTSGALLRGPRSLSKRERLAQRAAEEGKKNA